MIVFVKMYRRVYLRLCFLLLVILVLKRKELLINIVFDMFVEVFRGK